MNKWTNETALAYLATVAAGKNPRGLKYCSAFDYVNKVGLVVPTSETNKPKKAKKKKA